MVHDPNNPWGPIRLPAEPKLPRSPWGTSPDFEDSRRIPVVTDTGVEIVRAPAFLKLIVEDERRFDVLDALRRMPQG